MKKFLYYFLFLTFIIISFISCSTKNPLKEARNNGSTEALPKVLTPPEIKKESLEVPIPNTIPIPQQAPIITQLPKTKQAPSVPATPKKNKPKKKPLGSYSTPLLNKDKERVENIRLALKRIDGLKLEPEETFSFNSIVGKRDAEHGFKIATVIIRGEYGEDMGGGVCQLSSTIFNAADKAQMKIIERHNHSKGVRYVPEGRDAAVSYPYLDFKFINTREFPVKITARVSGNSVIVSIWKA